MKTLVKESLILFAIASVAASLLGVVYNITKPIIDENFAIAQQNAMQKVVPSATDFKEVKNLNIENSIKGLNVAYNTSGDIVGYVVSSSPSGYGGQIDMMVGFDTNANINHIDVIRHSETPGLGALITTDSFKSQFDNKSGELYVTKSTTPSEQEISAITSSTITTRAVVNGTNDATNLITNYIGGTN